MTAVACSRKSGSYFRQVSGGVFPSAALTGKKSSVGLRITWYPQFTPDQTARMTTTPATTRIAGGAARIAETARRLHRASGRTDAREGALPARECDMEGMRSLCLSARTLASLPRLEPPVLIPGRLGAHPLAGDRHLDQVRAVVARDPVHAAPERRLELLRGGDALAVHALSAGECDVVGRGGAEIEAGVGAVPHHLAVRDLARPVVSHDLIALVVRDDGEDRRVVPGHRPEPHRAIGEGAIDRKSTRLNSSHGYISYAVFCLKKKKKTAPTTYNEFTTQTDTKTNATTSRPHLRTKTSAVHNDSRQPTESDQRSPRQHHQPRSH